MTITDNQTLMGQMLEVINHKSPDPENPFWKIGFDGEAARLGWVIPPTFEEIENSLNYFLSLNSIQNKDTFIFSGMGGSINTIKAVETILKTNSSNRVFCIDSLDPAALKEIDSQISDWSKVAVIGISKSGTTKETLSLLLTLKEKFTTKGLDYKNHYLWIVDMPNKTKVEEAGFEGVDFMPIQVNRETDIGGRFTAPHTLIFLIPFLLLLNKDFAVLKDLWQQYLDKREQLLKEATNIGKTLAQNKSKYFAVKTDEQNAIALETWIIQLFQESLGSKLEGFSPKTIVTASKDLPKDFAGIMFDIKSDQLIVKAMLYMYLCQIVVAAISKERMINFVTQPEVEIYKKKMKEISTDSVPESEKVPKNSLNNRMKEIIKNETKFIEAVCYWYLTSDERQTLHASLQSQFPNLNILVFTGSDWNHHSYQAASKNQDTVYLVLTKADYEILIDGFNGVSLEDNIKTLKTIAFATYSTLTEKASYLTLTE
jgi:glucosamine 6-phosphate synthetase-like amidotransferase/phosphosugar isomerase protein